jgi:hypothetical protein
MLRGAASLEHVIGMALTMNYIATGLLLCLVESDNEKRN